MPTAREFEILKAMAKGHSMVASNVFTFVGEIRTSRATLRRMKNANLIELDPEKSKKPGVGEQVYKITKTGLQCLSARR